MLTAIVVLLTLIALIGVFLMANVSSILASQSQSLSELAAIKTALENLPVPAATQAQVEQIADGQAAIELAVGQVQVLVPTP